MNIPRGLPAGLATVVESLSVFPGIGPKSALRVALHMLRRPSEEAHLVANSLLQLHDLVGFCPRCGCFSENDSDGDSDKYKCNICDDTRRDMSLLCVVEQAADVLLLGRSDYRGCYHALHGRLSPLDGVSIKDLRIAALDKRMQTGTVREIILATSATLDGEATAHILSQRYASSGAQISRIARGIPEGGELEYTDEYTLARAVQQRVRW
ncbi:MAG: recombination mediator RecR [Mariprofundales bacterium]